MAGILFCNDSNFNLDPLFLVAREGGKAKSSMVGLTNFQALLGCQSLATVTVRRFPFS